MKVTKHVAQALAKRLKNIMFESANIVARVDAVHDIKRERARDSIKGMRDVNLDDDFRIVEVKKCLQ